MTRVPSLVVRAARPDEGATISVLWRELWDAHEAWGGYAGSRDSSVYASLAQRLSEDARVRGGQPILGRHIHLVAVLGGVVIGQVEGWFERHGVDEATPFTCEVRSLVVSSRARACGAGRALLDTLASVARGLSRGAPVVLAAEVLSPNPAYAFYTRVGYVPVSWAARVATDGAAESSPFMEPYLARVAHPSDALPVALLDPALAARRRSHGDVRFDRPRAIDATFVGGLAAHLAKSEDGCASELVAVDRGGFIRASASLTVMTLEAPFVPTRRGLLSRFAMDPSVDPRPLVGVLVRLGRRLARARGALTLELTDLDPPGQLLHEGVMRTGATPWSRIVERFA